MLALIITFIVVTLIIGLFCVFVVARDIVIEEKERRQGKNADKAARATENAVAAAEPTAQAAEDTVAVAEPTAQAVENAVAVAEPTAQAAENAVAAAESTAQAAEDTVI